MVSAFWVFLIYPMEAIVEEKTITVTIVDIIYNPPGLLRRASYQLKFADGTWVIVQDETIIESLKIGYTYRLTLVKKRAEDKWTIIRAVEVGKPQI